MPEDENGDAMKIYDARANGGFPTDPPPLPCQASDECHGPGTRGGAAARHRHLQGHRRQLEPQPPKRKHHSQDTGTTANTSIERRRQSARGAGAMAEAEDGQGDIG